MIDILLVEDNRELAELLQAFLEKDGFSVSSVSTGEEASAYLEENCVKILLLDIMLPGMDGFAVCRAVREKGNIPILIMSARAGKDDKLNGFELGADDYIAKPFRPLELVSRVKNVLRRRGRSRSVLRAGDLLVDTVKGTVTRDGQEIILSALEYRLFLVFLNRQGEVLTRNRLLEEIWDIAGDYVNDNTLTVYIKRLRDKIEKDPAHPEIIETVRGRGYKVG